MRDSESKCCVNLTIIVIVSVACIVLGVAIYALVQQKTPSDVHLTSANTTIPRPDLLTKTANIATYRMRPVQSVIYSDDIDLSDI